MNKKATCFFCYSWDNKIYDILVYIKQIIERTSNNTVSVVLDKLDYRYNDNFDKKLEDMKTYDLIVPFFTPEFKALILDHISGRELVREYQVIEERFAEDQDSIFPVIYSGNTHTALPSLFNKQICPIISEMNLQVDKDDKSKVYVSNTGKAAFDKFIRDLVGLARLNYNKHSTEYKSAKEALDKLFYLTNTTQLPTSCLIKMDAYDKIINQRCYFVVGRKGSGKSTFLKNLCKVDPQYFYEHYKKLTPICADNLNLDHIYSVISKHKADKIEIPSKELITLYWEILLVLLCIYVVGIEDEEGKIGDERALKFRATANRLKELLGLKTKSGDFLSFKKDGVLKLLSTTAIEFIDDSFNFALQEANADNLIASFKANLTTTNILNRKIGEDLLDEFALALEKCEKRIIISIDGFDKESEVFRRETQYLNEHSLEYEERLNFEIAFYGQLLEVVSSFKFQTHNDPIQNVMQEYLDFCIVLPKDRYDQIVRLDRDSAKKQFCSLDWDEYDLMDLITCRLEYIIKKKNGGGYKFPETQSLKERFDFAVHTYVPNLPANIYINVDGNNLKFDLFNYILRLSFWRPRDIISHFASILPIFLDEGYDDELLQNELLKLTLKSSAKKIIKEEFIKEYENVFMNLEEVLHHFDGCDLIMDAQKFVKILAGIRFRATFAYNLDEIQNKLYVLYQLGIIGLYFDEASYKKLGYRNRLCYVYNEGLEPIEQFNKKQDYNLSNPRIIFNTIFIESLSLNVNTKSLIGDFDWKYIELTHRLKPAIRRI